MKFNCEKCHQRYTIEDAKVKNRTVRIRCKRCKNEISIRDPSLPDRSSKGEREGRPIHRGLISAKDASARLDQSYDKLPLGKVDYEHLDQIAWHYAIAGQTKGPFTEDELIELFLSGQISNQSHVWNAGMTDWVLASEVPVFAPAVARDKKRNLERLEVPIEEPEEAQSPVLKLLREETQEPPKSSNQAVLARLRELREVIAPAQIKTTKPSFPLPSLEVPKATKPKPSAPLLPSLSPAKTIKPLSSFPLPPSGATKTSGSGPALPFPAKLGAKVGIAKPASALPSFDVPKADERVKLSSLPSTGVPKASPLLPSFPLPSAIVPRASQVQLSDPSTARPDHDEVNLLSADEPRALSIAPEDDPVFQEPVLATTPSSLIQTGRDFPAPALTPEVESAAAESTSLATPAEPQPQTAGQPFIVDLSLVNVPAMEAADLLEVLPSLSTETSLSEPTTAGLPDPALSAGVPLSGEMFRDLFVQSEDSEEQIDDSDIEAAFFEGEFREDPDHNLDDPFGDIDALVDEFDSFSHESEDFELHSADFAAVSASEERLTPEQRKDIEARKKAHQKAQKRKRTKTASKPYQDLLEDDKWRATHSVVVQLKDVQRKGRKKQYLLIAGLTSLVLVIIVGLPMIFSDGKQEITPLLTPPDRISYSNRQFSFMAFDLNLTATAIREATTVIDIGATLGLRASDDEPDARYAMSSPRQSSRRSERSERTASRQTDQTDSSQERQSSQSPSRQGSLASGPATPAGSAVSRYSRLQESRDVRVSSPTLEAPETTQRTHSSHLNAEYFAENLPVVRRAVQRCHDLQLRESTGSIAERVELAITVHPSGQVEVDMASSLERTAFGRCMRTRYTTWRFRQFSGEPITLRQTFALQ